VAALGRSVRHLLHLWRPFLVKWDLSPGISMSLRVQRRTEDFMDSNETTRKNLFGDFIDDVNFNHKV
jgi:hypothetical protein